MPNDVTVFHDDRIYLEQVDGAKATEWVAGKNRTTLERLRTDPRYTEMENLVKAAAQNADRIAYPAFGDGGRLYNFWTDDVNLRGVWRSAARDAYFNGTPDWQTILDLDALSRKEGRNWTYAGAKCLPSDPDRCLVMLSDGGRDAVTIREFDVAARAFIPDGFELPEAKQAVSWVDSDTIYVSREWDTGDVTQSGYAYITKALGRGQALEDAREIFRGQRTDISAQSSILRDSDHKPVGQMNMRQLTGEEAIIEFEQNGRTAMFPLPTTAQFLEYFNGQLVYKLKEDWTSAGGRHFAAESLIAFDFSSGMAHPGKIEPKIVFSPAPHQAVLDAMGTRNRLLVKVLSNVAGEIYSVNFEDGVWKAEPFRLPQNSSVYVLSADEETDDLFLTVEGFLEPTRLYRANAASMETVLLQTERAEFDASQMQVTQNWVTSKDGTKVPYFLVAKKDIPLDGSNPALIYGYGGFGVAMTPSYLRTLGKIWLEKGGVYVVPNIRGGGEFGEKWHKSGLTTNRQHVFDDFQAVAEDLIARKITAPRRLGISGGSNGGLLTGVQLVQHPELWNAVVISVPLLDMMRYDVLLAGASWQSEYGDPANPVEGAFLRSISPYHNLKPGTHYPEPLFLTSRADDRVHPGHARKMAARMDGMGMPNLFFESDDGGHGGARTSWDKPDAHILKWVYLMQKLMD